MFLIFCLVLGGFALPAPEGSFDVINEIFGNTIGGGYGSEGGNKTSLEVTEDALDVLNMVQGITSAIPTDIPEPSEEDIDQAEVAVDTAFENCEDYSSFGFECVPYYQCHNGSIITDGEGIINIRNGFGNLDSEASKCSGFLDVCCKDPNFIEPLPAKEDPYIPKCGRHNVGGINVKVEGFQESESQFGEWPHMCAVLSKTFVNSSSEASPESVNIYQCGGSLIAPGVILTAGHCVDKFRSSADKLVVRCGEWNTQDKTEPLPHQDRLVANITVHPEFNSRNLANDFALLFTTNEFDLSPHIDTVCLPSPEETFDPDTCFATGWGKDKFGAAGNYQVVLKEIDLAMVGHGECQDRLRSTRLGRRFRLHDSFICAGGADGKDTCKGDGGSPLVCPAKYNQDTFVQAGIVAWGIGCGEDGTPGVYASVSRAVCWIDYAMSCYYGATSGIFSSYWGYSADVCGVWMEETVIRLKDRRARGNRQASTFFSHQIDQYQKCDIHWNKEIDTQDHVATLAKLDKEGNGGVQAGVY